MERFFKLLYYYCLGLFFLFVVYMITVMFLSPRQDAEKRGFIPCTEELVYGIANCEAGKMSCTFGYLWNDTKCNVNVILNGLGAWAKGQQATPWANYLFTPVTEAEQEGISFDKDDGSEITDDFIKAKKQELEEAKNRNVMLDETVLVNLPGTLQSDDSDATYVVESETENVYSDNISAEVSFDEIPVSDSISYVSHEQSVQSDDVVGNLKKITDAKLKEGKNEK